MKKLRVAAVIALVILILNTTASAEGTDADALLDNYTDIYSEYLLNGSEEVIDNALSPYANGFTLSELLSRIAKGEISLSAKGVLSELSNALFGEVIGVFKTMMLVIGLVVLSSLLSGLSSGLGRESVNNMAKYVCFIAVIGITSSVFYDVISVAEGAIENLALFMRSAVPVMIASLIASGAIVSASTLEPFMLGITEAALSLIQYLFMPLVMIGAALGIVNSLSDELKTTGLISLINKTVKYGLSVLLTIFVAFAGLKSIASAGADGLTIKLTKFASSNLIPVVGGILSDAVVTVMNCSEVIKNALGVIGVIIVFFIAVMPVVKIIAALLIFRVVAAICEPIGSKSTVECITVMANGISTVFSMLAAVTIMFIMIITIMINISV